MFNDNLFVDGSKDIIEIVSSDSALGLLKKADNVNYKVFLPLWLNIGRLDDIDKYDRSSIKEYFDSNIKLFENGFNFSSEFNKLKVLINESNKVRVWSSHLDAEDYCLLLFICHYFKDKNISVIFTESYNWYATTLGLMDKSDIKILYNYEHLLKDYEKEQYNKEWNQIIDENSSLRIMINGTVKSVKNNYFDIDILNRLKELGKVTKMSLIGNLIGTPPFPMLFMSDIIYSKLIDNLIKENKIIKSIDNNGKEYLEISSFSL